jgi:hypothetical protein
MLRALSFVFQTATLGHFAVQLDCPLLYAVFELDVGLLHGRLSPQASKQEGRLVRTHCQQQ